MDYIVKTPLLHDGKPYEVDAVITIKDKAQAAALLAAGAISAIAEKPKK